MTHTKARPHFDLDLKFGQQKENELQTALEGKVEVKTDRLCKKTGNVFVEIEDRGKPSGINNTKSTYYAFCLYKAERKKQTFVLIATKVLKKLMRKYPIKKGGDNWEARGHIIPVGDLLSYEV